MIYEQACRTPWQHLLAHSAASVKVRVPVRPFACLFCIVILLKMVSKWSSEDVVKFLDVYEESEGLWNIRHSDYNNKMKRDSAMLKLMGELLERNVAVESVEVLRKKIKSIKNVYRQEFTPRFSIT